MHNHGFTLVEMLAVVIILSVFGLIGIVSVESIIKKGTEKSYQAQMGEIKTAAENSIKVDGEPVWCKGVDTCFISLRYLTYGKYLKLNENGEFINPKTDKPFSLETVVMVKKYGQNYYFEAYDSLEALETSYLAKAKREALMASAFIYKHIHICNQESSCLKNAYTFKTSDLVKEEFLEANFYNEITINIDENDNISLG